MFYIPFDTDIKDGDICFVLDIIKKIFLLKI